MLVGATGIDGLHSWAWDGNTWRALGTGGLPAGLREHASAFDAASQRVLLFGGRSFLSSAPFADTLLHGSVPLASVQSHGIGCGGIPGPPLLGAGPPVPGNAGFVLDLLDARPASLCLLAIAAQSQTAALGPCTLYLRGPLVPMPTFTNAAGFASVKLAVPQDPTLRGQSIHAQGFIADPLGGFANLAFTAGLRLTFGD